MTFISSQSTSSHPFPPMLSIYRSRKWSLTLGVPKKMLYAHLSYPYMLPVLPNLIVNHFFRPPVSYSFIDPNIYTFTLPIIIACYLCHNFHGRTNSEKEMHAPSCSKHGCKLGDFFHHGMQVVHQQSSKTFHNFLSFLDTFGSAVL
jgi:hypothetical protein